MKDGMHIERRNCREKDHIGQKEEEEEHECG